LVFVSSGGVDSPAKTTFNSDTVTAATHLVEFDGALARRGFWLYVFEATAPDGKQFLYVGRTGDSSSFNAQSPYRRLGQHLGNAATTSQMRRHLEKHGLEPEACRYRFIAFGPVFAESEKDRESHYPLRDKVAAMEKELAKRLGEAGYSVLNDVRSRKALDEDAFRSVVAAFAPHFSRLDSTELSG
jgi:hypothetical protein